MTKLPLSSRQPPSPAMASYNLIILPMPELRFIKEFHVLAHVFVRATDNKPVSLSGVTLIAVKIFSTPGILYIKLNTFLIGLSSWFILITPAARLTMPSPSAPESDCIAAVNLLIIPLVFFELSSAIALA